MKFFKFKLRFQVFGLLVINLLLIAACSLFVSNLLWKGRQQREIFATQNQLVLNITNVFESYYSENGNLPVFSSDADKKSLERILKLRNSRFILGEDAIEAIQVLDENRHKIYSVADEFHNENLLENNRGPNYENNEIENDFRIVEYPLFNKGRIIGYALLPNYNFTLNNNRSVLVNDIFTRVAVLLLLVLIICSVMSLIFSNWLLKPIKNINYGLKELENKNFKIRLSEKGKNEIGQLTKNFNQMANQMDKLVESKKIWIASISHELKTPLTILRGEIEAMQDGVRKISKNSLKNIHQEILALTNMTIELQEIANYEKEKVILKPIDANIVLAEVTNKFKKLLTAAKIKLILNIQKYDGMVLGNDSMLARAFSKILENSVKFCNPGNLIVSSSSDNYNWIVTFSDSGPGVDKKDFEKIFEYFYRTNVTRSQGSGLGLGICKAIVDIHDGKISASRSDSKGLKITISIPKFKQY